MSVVALRRGRGRLPAHLERLRDLEVEVVALADEGRDFAGRACQLARTAQLLLAAGHSPTTALDEIERLATRHETAMAAAASHARADRRCPDVAEPEIGHGRAA